MSVSDSPASSLCMFSGPLNPDPGSMSAPMPPLDAALYGPPDGRSVESMLGYAPYASCLSSGPERAAPQNQQDFPPFLLPPPASALRPLGQKRGPSKDSVEYRLRRERNNVAVRKSRDKARRRIQLTQQRALQLQDENHRLTLHIQRLTHEVDSLRHFLSQRHLQAKESNPAESDAL